MNISDKVADRLKSCNSIEGIVYRYPTMEMATNIFLWALIDSTALWTLIQLCGGTVERNTLQIAAVWGFLLAIVGYFGGSLLVPLPLLAVFSALLFYYDLGIGRSLGIVTALVMLSFILEQVLPPFLSIFFLQSAFE